MNQPIQHPPWCDRRHLDAYPVHSAEIGEVPVTERTSFDIQLHRWADGRAPVVTVTVTSSEEDTVTDLTPQQALMLARRLTEAAMHLLGTWAPTTTGGDPR